MYITQARKDGTVRKQDLQGNLCHAGEDVADCEELKYVPQGPDTTLLVTTGEKALAVKTRNTISIIALRPTGEVGVAYTTPGQHPAAPAARAAQSNTQKGALSEHLPQRHDAVLADTPS